MSDNNLNNLPKEKFVLVNENKKLHDKELVTKPIGFFADAMHRFAKNKGSIVAAVVIGILVLFAIIAPIISPYTVSYNDINYKYLLPRLFDSEYIDFLDGGKNATTNLVTFIERYAIGAENGHNAIKRQSYTYNEKTDMYSYRVNTYNAVGTIFMSSVSREDYYAIQRYQDKSGIQIIYPITDVAKRPKNQKNEKNANIWYETEPDPNSSNDIPVNFVKKDDGSFELKNIYKEYTTPVLNATTALANSARATIETKDDGHAIKLELKAGTTYGAEVLKEDLPLGYLSVDVENGTKNGTFLVDSLEKASKFEFDAAHKTFKVFIGGHTNPEDDGNYVFALPFTQGSTVALYKEGDLDLVDDTADQNPLYVPASLYDYEIVKKDGKDEVVINPEIVTDFALNKEYVYAVNRDRSKTSNYYAGGILDGTLKILNSKPSSYKFEKIDDNNYKIKIVDGKFSQYVKVSVDKDKHVFSRLNATAADEANVWVYDNTTGNLKTFIAGHTDASLDKDYYLGFDSTSMEAGLYDLSAFNDNIHPLKVASATGFDIVEEIDVASSYRLAYQKIIRNDKFFFIDGNFKGDNYFSKMRVEGEDNYLYDYAIQKDGDRFEIRVCYYEYYRYYHSQIKHDRITKPYFLFGTTKTGQDIFTCLSSGARFSFILAIVVASVNLIVGAIYGAIEGYYGGKVDMIMERIVEILSAVPFMIVITLLKYHMTKTPAALILFIAFFLTGWIGMSGTVRMQFYRFKNQEYVLAARTLGAKDLRIMFKHIFPNALGTIVTSCVLVIPGMIFSETSLSYLGIINLNSGDMTSVGTLLADAQEFIDTYPHMILFPAVFISLLMLSFNLFGNGLRDAFNPSLRGTED